MTKEEYIQDLSHPLAYYRIDKEKVEQRKDYFEKMFELNISCAYAILLMDSTLIKDLKL